MLKLSSENIEKLKSLKEQGLVSKNLKNKQSQRDYNSTSPEGLKGIYFDHINKKDLEIFFEAVELVNNFNE